MGWNEDLAMVKAIYQGHTSKGAADALGIELSAFNSRIRHLGLGVHECRRARMEGRTSEEYLESSPVYKKAAARPQKMEVLLKRQPGRQRADGVETPRALYNGSTFDGFYGLLFVPDDKRESPAFYLYAAARLEKAALELREKAAKIMQETMGGSLKKGA